MNRLLTTASTHRAGSGVLEVGPDVTERRATPPCDVEHGRRDVRADHPEALPAQERRQDAGAARRIEYEPPVGHAGQALRDGALGEAQVEPPSPAAVPPALVALGVEVTIPPAGIVIAGDGLRHDRATLTAERGAYKDHEATVKALPILLVACLMLFFPGLGSVPFYTRGEPREALVAREMVTTGEWLVPVAARRRAHPQAAAVLLGGRDGDDDAPRRSRSWRRACRRRCSRPPASSSPGPWAGRRSAAPPRCPRRWCWRRRSNGSVPAPSRASTWR